ncbi:General alpha-glucoside permease [Penicillium subrubescens]|uniref:General alpha-glucoside permease n=1 Tax=Penicillium subrubescens TaxID=1316194 RepID=A0A1Q5U9X9_9EURO|nr:General alpha-glucoside permease [Penicillium subrubescens]
MSDDFVKSSSSHHEWDEPAFLQSDQKLTLRETIQRHGKALLLCCIPFTAAVLFGYDTIVNGAAISMPAFIMYFGEKNSSGLYLPSLWTSLWTSMSALAQALAATGTGFLADRIGRKWSGCIAGVISLAGATVQYTAHTRSALLGGKIVSGLGIGMAMAAGTTYASEIVSPRLVSPVQQALVIFILIMQALAMGVIRIFVPDISEHSFRTVFAIQWGVGALVTIAFALAPESPIYSIVNNKQESAKKLFEWMYSDSADREERFNYLTKTIEEENSQQQANKARYVECFQGTNFKRTLTIMFLFGIVNLGGAPFLSQSIYFLISVGLPAIHVFDISVGGFGLAIIIIIASGILLKNFRRSHILFWGTVINLVFNLVIGALYYEHGDGPKWAIAILMNLLISLQAAFMQASGWSIAAEVSSYRLRAKSMALGMMAQTFTTWIITFVVPYMYNVDSGNLGARTGFVFAGSSVLLIWGVYALVPDTTGLSTEDLDNFYEAKVPVRKFATHKAAMQS